MRELLYALLLNSANDAARALAEKVSGSEEEFARQMTREVRQWGAYRTTLATANGLPADNQFSTAEDLAKMFKKAMENPELAKIMATKYYNIRATGSCAITTASCSPPSGGGGQDRLYQGFQAHLRGLVSKGRQGRHRRHDGEHREMGRFAASHREGL